MEPASAAESWSRCYSWPSLPVLQTMGEREKENRLVDLRYSKEGKAQGWIDSSFQWMQVYMNGDAYLAKADPLLVVDVALVVVVLDIVVAVAVADDARHGHGHGHLLLHQ